MRDALRSLPAPLLGALGRIGRGLRIHPLTIAVVFGGWEDPPAAAEAYGTANALVWTFMPLLERLLNIPDPDIRLDVDFTASRTTV
ncbi:MAG: DUF2953 domain-containing protein, partial [Oscillibacter sp.]|nr:DUF2953 domain-containing protein [Oscillibacter sp.]